MKSLTNRLLVSLLVLFVAIVLAVSVRGLMGNPTATQLSDLKWRENGPFELSPERGRFALLYSMAEDKSLTFSTEIGKFAEPDVAVSNGKYVSLFAPLVSFVAYPGYIIGKYFGAAQVGTFATVAVFGLLNMLLIRQIVIRMGGTKAAATVAGLVFLFATPAFAYAVNLYQHHLSTFLILLSIYALLKFKKIPALIVVFFLCATAIPLDYPNLFFLFPLGVYAFAQIFSYEKVRERVSLGVNFYRFLTLFIMILPILFFVGFNKASYNNPFQLSGTLQSVKDIQGRKDAATLAAAKNIKQNETVHKKTAIALFRTRNMLNGFYILLLSPDRGIIYYAPIVLFGIGGFLVALKKKARLVGVLAAIIGANLLLYSMWGDPWGGWAFGARYLIPSYAVLAIFTGILLSQWNKKLLFLVFFVPVALYSIAVNSLGAITTSAMPPQVEVLALEKATGTVQKYTYERNWDMLVSGNSKSFVYQTFVRGYLGSVQFYILIVSSVSIVVICLIAFNYFKYKKGGYNVQN